MKVKEFKFEFVSLIPNDLKKAVLYICLPCNVAIHMCACGCGEKVVTPIDPEGWKLIYDGESVSLSPSIGNWSYKCKSHYFIKNSKVEWARSWVNTEVEYNRKKGRRKKRFWEKVYKK